ncbi:A disintegrin and metalloproteinase with thrombospondin motifs 17-like [Ruditapes philippinarum]|uniref:A disintegrin and metalloproteinase with thrombospondin motifs 17-like n=1 Tax=Ruditapes philippinarum TaxID=129788 RepID=UPI00295AB2D3|nr:A disintegrin and metalloproteinase with thrombospondin motifs 17-like [Ruditapes philippinarum]
MYPSLFPPLDNFPYQNFGTFSECSADYISSYLSQFNSEDLATCLYTNRPTRKEFLNQFCQGLPGTKYGPDDQCKIFFGMNSSVCSSGNDKLLEGYVDYNRCRLELKDGSYVRLFQCSNEGDCENSYGVQDVFDGTRCLDEDGTMGDKYCYHGECQEKYKICNPEDYPGN